MFHLYIQEMLQIEYSIDVGNLETFSLIIIGCLSALVNYVELLEREAFGAILCYIF